MSSLDMFRLMAPYLILGLLAAGLLHALVPRQWVARHLGRRGLVGSVKAALVGVPLPLCSCGVIPFAQLLKRQGASQGATASFLISTPQTGADSVLATFSFFGWPLALWKVVTALVSGIVGGTVLSHLESNPSRHRHVAMETSLPDEGLAPHKPSPLERFRSSISFGFGELLEDVGLWLVVGILAAGVIAHFIPDGFIAEKIGNPHLQMLSVMLFAVPLYICATGSVPLAAALVMKGMSTGTAVVLLMAGPATNIATLLVFLKVLGKRFLGVYLATIVVFSYGFGLLFDQVFPNAQLAIPAAASHVHGRDVLTLISWWQWAASAALALALARVLWVKSRNRWGQRRAFRAYPQIAGGDETVLKVSGMSCEHCRRTVERALEGVPGVESVTVSLKTGEAVVRGGGVERAALVNAVRREDYEAAVKHPPDAPGEVAEEE